MCSWLEAVEVEVATELEVEVGVLHLFDLLACPLHRMLLESELAARAAQAVTVDPAVQTQHSAT